MLNKRNYTLEKMNLRYLRGMRGLSQQHISHELNCSRDTITKWENVKNTRKIPSPYLDDICRFFNVSKSDFCTRNLKEYSKKIRNNSNNAQLSKNLCEYADIMWYEQDYEESVDAYVHAIALGSLRAIKSLSIRLNNLPTASLLDIDGDGPYERIYCLTKKSFEKYSNSSIIRALKTAIHYPIL